MFLSHHSNASTYLYTRNGFTIKALFMKFCHTVFKLMRRMNEKWYEYFINENGFPSFR